MPLRCRPISTRLTWSGVRLCSRRIAMMRVERGMGVAAARIGFNADLHGLVGRAEARDRLVRMGVVAVADEQAVLAFDRFGRADEVVARQRGGDHAVHGGGADLIALVPGAVDQELQRARGLAAGDAEGGDDLLLATGRTVLRRPPRRHRCRRSPSGGSRAHNARSGRAHCRAGSTPHSPRRSRSARRGRRRRPFRRPRTQPAPPARSRAARSPRGCRRNPANGRARR